MFDVAQHMQPGDEKANPLLAGAPAIPPYI